MPSGRTRYSGHREFHINMRKNFITLRVTEHWKRLPREAVEYPSPEIFKTYLDTFMYNLPQGDFFCRGLDAMIFRDLF